MKLMIGMVLAFSAAAAAASPPAPAPVQCKVADSKGQILQGSDAVTQQTGQGSQLVSASSELFAYAVELKADRSATLTFKDKRSGDSAIVDEGEFSPGEIVGVALVTNEKPGAPLKLTCEVQ